MSGHQQGEFAKVDLTNGCVILRVLMECRHNGMAQSDYIISVKRYDFNNTRNFERCIDSVTNQILWNGEGNLICEYKFYGVDEDWYCQEKELYDLAESTYESRMSKNSFTQHRNIENPQMLKIARKAIKRKLGSMRGYSKFKLLRTSCGLYVIRSNIPSYKDIILR